jgi:large subunit ribosomal protein L3
MGDRRITTQNLKVVRTDVERGLIMIEGAVPGAKGGWIQIKDAVKKPAHKDIAVPGSFKPATAAAVAEEAK